MRVFWVLFAAAAVCAAQSLDISGARIREHTKFLASDLLEGRGVGSRGGDLAVEYIASQLALAGAKPAGDNGTYYQRVPLVGVTTGPAATLEILRGGGATTSLRWNDDWVGVTQRQVPEERFEAECIFVGHGISAPEFQWDDYKGVDVRGKIVVLFTNEPTSTDPAFFGGRALTYYGRWTYKYEEAQRRGALGALILHTTPTAGYGWEVVRNSWGKEDSQVKLASGSYALAITGWLSQEISEGLLRGIGSSVDEMLKAAESRSFKPIPLGVKIRGHLPTTVRAIESRNVAAMFPGSDPKLKDEYVVFSAHWDHLGIGTPVNGDAIYNGAVDNATGCAVLLEIARSWGTLVHKPRRSVLFLSVTAEEGGLRGSEYYAQHPLVPPSKTAIDINYDAMYPFGRTLDVVVGGAERTNAYPVVQESARRMRLEITPDPRPEQGSYFRSDHFSMARAGIPAFTIKTGSRFAGKPEDFSAQMFREYNTRSYHQPSDEFREDWDFTGVEDLARLGTMIGITVANQPGLPTWRSGDEYLRIREKGQTR